MDTTRGGVGPASATCPAKSPLPTKGASPASALGWNGRIVGSTLEEGEGKAPACLLEGDQGPTAAGEERNGATGPPQKIESE